MLPCQFLAADFTVERLLVIISISQLGVERMSSSVSVMG